MSKINEALEKLERECEKDINDNNIVLIANHLREIVSKSEDAAEKVLSEDKTIKGALEKLFSVAQSRRNGKNMVMISTDEGIDIINKYYGFGIKAQILPAVAAPPPEDDEVVSLLDLM